MNVYTVTVTADVKEIPKWHFVIGADSPEDASSLAIDKMKKMDSFENIDLIVLPEDCRLFTEEDYKKMFVVQKKLIELIEETAARGCLGEDEKECAIDIFQEMFDYSISVLNDALKNSEDN